MTEYRHGAHTVFRLHLHVVWTTKYRKPVMTGEVSLQLRELIREIYGNVEVTIIKGHVAKDHVHLFVSVPPRVTISRLVQALRGTSPYKMLHEFPHLQKKFWGRHLWARGYFCVSSGNVTDEVIRVYISNKVVSKNTRTSKLKASQTRVKVRHAQDFQSVTPMPPPLRWWGF